MEAGQEKKKMPPGSVCSVQVWKELKGDFSFIHLITDKSPGSTYYGSLQEAVLNLNFCITGIDSIAVKLANGQITQISVVNPT